MIATPDAGQLHSLVSIFYYELEEMTIKPKAAIDKAMAGDKFFQLIDEIRTSVKDVDPEELEATIAKAVQAAKKVTAKKLKARPKQ